MPHEKKAENLELTKRVTNRKGIATEAEVVKELASDILKGLVYLHENGVIHRDLKSKNILLTQEQRLKAKIAGMLLAL